MAGRTEGGPPSLPRAHVGREEEIMFIVLLVYQSPPLSLLPRPHPRWRCSCSVGFVNLNSPLSLEGGNIQRMSFEFPDYSFPS